jgi:hypothetical protein
MAGEEWVFALAALVAVAGMFASSRYTRRRAWSMDRRRLITMLGFFFPFLVVLDSWLVFGAGGLTIGNIVSVPFFVAVGLGSVWLMNALCNSVLSAISHLLRTH